MKLNGRAEAPDGRRGHTLSSSARGAKQTTHHGPLQRLLGATRHPSSQHYQRSNRQKQQPANGEGVHGAAFFAPEHEEDSTIEDGYNGSGA